MHGLGRVYMEPKGHIVLDRYQGEWEVMPSWIEEPEAAACKWVSIREDNSRYELPAVFSILVYTHPETGFPLAICDGSYHTLMRTGASAAVSAKWLARKGSKVLAIVGAGSVGQGTLATCEPVFAWEQVRVWSRSQESVDRFLESERPRFPALELTGSTDLEQVVRDADVVAARHPRGAGSSTTPGSRRAHISRPSALTSRASRSSTRASCSALASSSTTSASAGRTARSTSRCARGSSARRTSPARSAR